MPDERRLRSEPRNPLRFITGVGATGLAVALVLASIFALNLNLSRLKDSFRWVQHTDDVLLQLAAVEADLIDGESGERGYLLTGDADYLGPYERARDDINRQIDSLAALVADSPAQSQELTELRAKLDERFEEFRTAIEYGPARLQDALGVLKTARNERLTPSIREALARFREAELQLLAERQSRAERDAEIANLLAIAAGVLALGSLALALFLFQRQQSRHRIEQLQRELIHISRLNTMGQTASMLAHEVRQPLTATTNYLLGVRRMMESTERPPVERVVDALQKATAQVERAGQIVARLRRFVDKRQDGRRPEDVAVMIEEALSLIEIDRAGVTLRRRIETGLPPALVDKVQIQQVLINLIRNAIEAMAESPRREITVAATRSDGMIAIAVQDTGPGLPPAVAEKLFQPFVTTKEEGMGVGLSICRTIIEAHHGRIWAEPRAGEGGTSFRFSLPTAEPSAPLG